MSARWGLIVDLGRAQHSVVARRQLTELGFRPAAVRHLCETGRLHPLHRGVYVVGRADVSLRGRWMGAALACGEGALVSHGDAAALHGLLPVGGRLIHVTVPGQSRRGIQGLQLHRVRSLHPHDRALKDGIPVTSVARTLLDVAETEPERRAMRAFEQAERLRLFDLGAVDELRARSRGRRGLKPMKALLRHCCCSVTDARSELEQRFVEFCREHRIPMPAMNVALEGFEVDAHWPGTPLVVELDSFTHHSPRSAFESDRERDLVLGLAEYRVVRVTWRMVTERPEKLEQRIRRLLAD
jgi:very-short-patch-repair endonuclease